MTLSMSTSLSSPVFAGIGGNSLAHRVETGLGS